MEMASESEWSTYTWEEFMRSKAGDTGKPGTALSGSIYNWDETLMHNNGDSVGAASMYRARIDQESERIRMYSSCPDCTLCARHSGKGQETAKTKKRHVPIQLEKALCPNVKCPPPTKKRQPRATSCQSQPYQETSAAGYFLPEPATHPKSNARASRLPRK